MVQATPDGLFEKQIFSSLPRIKLYKKLILYNGQAGCGKLNCRSSKLSYRKEDLKWALSQLRKRCRFIFRKSTRGGFRLAPLKVYLANQNIRPIFCLIHIIISKSRCLCITKLYRHYYKYS